MQGRQDVPGITLVSRWELSRNPPGNVANEIDNHYHNRMSLVSPAAAASLSPHPLWGVALGQWTQVASLEMPEQERRWLAAMGVHAGARLVVLRTAAWGGPLHVRTASGGTFALGAALARQVMVVQEATPT